jgi:eukaryotic-like serine/threonine-protein kinase
MEKKLPAQRNKLRQLRELQGWTQKDVADKLYLPDTRTLRRWESGDAVPSLRYRAKLCEIFERSPEELGLISENHQCATENEELYVKQSDSSNYTTSATPSQSQLPILLKKLSVSSNDWDRQRLLEKVYTFWIKEVLEQTSYGKARIALKLREQPNAVVNPWERVIEQPQQSPHSWPLDAPMTQIYDDVCGELLILGEPGAGKTTLLLELARDLLLRAGENKNHPIPVIFNLSSWAMAKLDLFAWLVEELNSKYNLPRQIGRAWVGNDYILPLLDGLDEVSPALRNACVNAINDYRQSHGLLPMVVCSRKEEYLKLTTRLLLHKAICIEPLTYQQIDAYLSDKDGQLEALRLAIRDDADLQQLVTAPLMLSVLEVAYQDQPFETLNELGSDQLRRKQLFATYVECMLKRRKGGKHYPIQKSIFWLKYLARQMKQRDQTEFYLERMQLDWLPTRRLQQMCYGLFVGLWAGVLSGVLVGYMAKSLGEDIIKALVITPCMAIVVGCIVGMAASLLENALSHPIKKVLIGVTAASIVSGGTIWLNAAFPVLDSMQYGVAVGLIIVLVLLLSGIKDMRIQPTELVSWSWMRMWKNVFSFSSILLALIWISSEVIGSMFGWFDPDLGLGIIVVLLFGLLSFFVAGLFSGFSSEMFDRRLIREPNQGIWHSAYYALLNGLLAGLLNWFALATVGIVIERFFPRLVVTPNFVIWSELAFSLALGLIISIHKGGEACIKHLLLRFMLCIGRHIPWNYPRFLNYAAEHILLYKVGGGYIFVHRWLLDYFADTL